MAESEDVNTLKRRGRRRLVGAIALVLAAVIVLPMVFDSEPRGTAPPVSVRIPSEDESGFTPKVTPKGPPPKEVKPAAKAPLEAAPAEKAPVEKATAPVAGKPEPKPEPKIEVKVTKSETRAAETPAQAAERAKAEAALAGGEQFVVPAGAYVDPAGVIEKLKAAGIPFYTEPLAIKGGSVTRVRAGPFTSREAADKVQRQLKELGLKPGSVAAKS
jgi:DedD protein